MSAELTDPGPRFVLRLIGVLVLGWIGLAHVGQNGAFDQTALMVGGILFLVFPQLVQDFIEFYYGNSGEK